MSAFWPTRFKSGRSTEPVTKRPEAVWIPECREIALITEADDATFQISVTDNGPGLPEEVRAKLFQPFVSTKRTGMGIGLSICHTIITAHGGDLWAEPNPDGGTIFRFTLSIAPARA